MNAHRLWSLAALLFLAPALAVRAGDTDASTDPLPKGAKLRLGSDRLTYRYPPMGTLLPPDYKTFLIPDVPLGFRRYDATSGQLLDSGKGGGNPGGQVVVSGDGKRAVVVHTGILTVRDSATGEALRELKPPAGFGTFVTFGGAHVTLSGDGKVAAHAVTDLKDKSGTVLVWDVDQGTALAQFDGLQIGGVLPVLSPDGKRLATRSATFPFIRPGEKRDDSGYTVQVWDVAEKKELFKARVTGDRRPIADCVFSPDGTLLAASCGEGPIDLWDVKTQKPKATFLGRTGQGHRIAFSPDGKALAAVADDGAVQRWGIADGNLLATTEPPTDLPSLEPRGIAFANNERVVVWGALGTTAVAWEAPSGKFFRSLGAHTAGIKSIGFADGGKRIVTAGLDGRVVTWEAATGKPGGTMVLRSSRTTACFQPPPNLFIARDAARIVATGNPTAVFDPTGTELFVVPPSSPAGVVIKTIPSADGARAITLSATSEPIPNSKWSTAVWDLVARKKVAEWELPVADNTGPNASAAISPSGNRLVVARYAKSANTDQTVLVVTGFDLKTGKKLGDVEDHTVSGVVSVAAASETTAVVSSGTGRLRLFNYEDGRGGDEIEAGGRGEPGGAVVFSPDGKRFAFAVPTDAPDAFGVRVYAWPSGRALHTFTGHRGPVTALCFSPDGQTLASGSADTTVLLWNLGEIDNQK